MSLFIEWSWLALLPASLFLALYRVSRRRFVAAVAVTWSFYALYEYAMHRRWLCTGECNIRVDLLLLYPVLVLISVIASIVAVWAMVRRRAAS
ncbi:MAG TPA: hypothetical protein VGC99_25140 [Candidatus Tectomicrobia bacterium]